AVSDRQTRATATRPRRQFRFQRDMDASFRTSANEGEAGTAEPFHARPQPNGTVANYTEGRDGTRGEKREVASRERKCGFVSRRHSLPVRKTNSPHVNHFCSGG